jgi:mRNA-degrading endonuclease RelE of RelBE toxin-antitoxin system
LDEDFTQLTEKAEEGILKKLEVLKASPDYGKPLTHEFAGLRRLTYGQYRIVYRYHQQSDTVFVILVPLRKGGDIDDIYSMMHRLLQAGKLEGAVEQIRGAQKMNRQLLEHVQENVRRRRAEKRKGSD